MCIGLTFLARKHVDVDAWFQINFEKKFFSEHVIQLTDNFPRLNIFMESNHRIPHFRNLKQHYYNGQNLKFHKTVAFYLPYFLLSFVHLWCNAIRPRIFYELFPVVTSLLFSFLFYFTLLLLYFNRIYCIQSCIGCFHCLYQLVLIFKKC